MPYADRERQREYLREWNKRRGEQVNAKKRELKASGCLICGERELCCLSFHHIEPSEKSYNISSVATMRKRGRIESEAAKCVVLCENCHRKVHAGIIELDPAYASW